MESRVTLLNEKVTEILKHKPEELTDTKVGFFTPDMTRCVFFVIVKKYFKVENIPQHNDCRL